MIHADTIGTIEHGGKSYEVDWPEDPGDETKRNVFGFIYLDGRVVGDCSLPGFEQPTSEQQVMDAARQVITEGGTDDQH